MVEHWYEWPLLVLAVVAVWCKALYCWITGKDFTEGWG